ncbi:MAG: carbamoyltransferase HypF [Nitriliruptoraceae bacterium]
MSVTRLRTQLRVTGVVQGVGFRPFVHRLAHELRLTGHVGNDAGGVFIEVAGPEDALERFTHRLTEEAPPLARIDAVVATALPPDAGPGPDTFTIVASPVGGTVATSVPPDIAICAPCRRELLDPTDRRFRHPFITCTDCGPRYTIIRSLPYDRPATTMADLAMCSRCAAEYEDPTNRRFHAQPIACPDCGPTLRFETGGARADGLVGTEPALAAARACLAADGIVAVKGVGGFHLATSATSAIAVAALRRRKHRPDKPFAVMVRDLETARRLVWLSEREEAALRSPQAPVVLARARHDPDPLIAPEVAPGNPLLGVMLPSSPLHVLLLAAERGSEPHLPPALVMTSGNLSGEPICFEDDDAGVRLAPLVDGFLTHDRPIHVPCDDGVVREIDGEVVPIRRSRGDTPLPLELPASAPPSLAVGAELKNTIGLAVGRRAWLSQHLGDMGALESLQAFERSVTQLTGLFDVEATHVAVDPHPSYATHAWARRHHPALLAVVQHHHAHVAALLAEHGLPPTEEVLGVAFDGTGFGTDGTVWGGEFLRASQARSTRLTHLRATPLPGGDSAVANPARMALAHLWAAGLDWAEELPCVAAVPPEHRRLLLRQFERDIACVPTSSMGRLFDAVAALLGVRQSITYEGQAAIELEWLADAHPGADAALPCYRFAFTDVLDPAPVLRAMVADLVAGVDRTAIAAGFHLAVTRAIVAVAERVAAEGGPRTVGLTGGVFQNAWLATRTRAALETLGHRVLTHRTVPANDGGLAFGQLAVVAARHEQATHTTR